MYPPVSVPRNVVLEHNRVSGHDQFLDIQVEIGKCLVVAADGLDPGRRTRPERICVFLAVEIVGRFVVSAIPDLVNEPAHQPLALGICHDSTPFFAVEIQGNGEGPCNYPG